MHSILLICLAAAAAANMAPYGSSGAYSQGQSYAAPSYPRAPAYKHTVTYYNAPAAPAYQPPTYSAHVPSYHAPSYTPPTYKAPEYKPHVTVTSYPATSSYSSPASYSSNSYSSPSYSSGSSAGVIRYEHEISDNGQSYSFDTSDGIHQDQRTAVQVSGGYNHMSEYGEDSGAADITKTGSYSWTAPDGYRYSVRYVADKDGYRAFGDHLPTPPPIPAEILASLYHTGTSNYGDSSYTGSSHSSYQSSGYAAPSY